MKLPYMANTEMNIQKAPLLFRGLNQGEVIDDTEFKEGSNLEPTLLPAIGPRPPMQVLIRFQNVQAIGVYFNKLVYVANETLYINGEEVGTLTEGPKTLLDFNNLLIIMPDKKAYNYLEDEMIDLVEEITIEPEDPGDEPTTETRDLIPDLDYLITYYNRVFGIKGSDIRASKLGDATEWEEYNGTAMDSYATDVYSPGDFTGITVYQDHLIFFKRDAMYELYGYIPSQFKVQDASTSIGCIDNKSIVEIAGVLYFASEKGVFAYQGGPPRPVSENLDEVYTRAAAITDGRTYYISLYNGKDYKVYAYDTWNRAWTPYADLNITDFFKSGEVIYALLDTGALIVFNDSTNLKRYEDSGIDSIFGSLFLETAEELETVEWSMTTKNFDDGIYEKKHVKAIRLKCTLELNTSIFVYVNLDNKGFTLKRSYTHDGINKTRDIIITLLLERASTYQFKIEGIGKAIIYGEREIQVGSER